MPPFPIHAPLVISAGNLNDKPGAPSIPTDFTVRMDSILTRNPRERTVPVAQVPDRCSVRKPPHHSVASNARSIIGRSMWLMVPRFDMAPSVSDFRGSIRRN